MELKAFNQRLGTLSILGEFHFCDILRAFFISSTIIYFYYTFSFNSLQLFSFLVLIFEPFSIFIITFSIPLVLSHKLSISSLVRGFFSKYFLFILFSLVDLIFTTFNIFSFTDTFSLIVSISCSTFDFQFSV